MTQPAQPSKFDTPPSEGAHILVVGAGAVGSYFGGRLLQAGCQVTFFAKGERLQQLESTGLLIKSVDGDIDLPTVPATNVLHAPVDIILLCGKTYAMPTMLDDIQPAVGDDTLIVSLQNGYGNENLIAERYGMQQTVGGVAFVRATRHSNGTVVHAGEGRLTLGWWSPPTTPNQQQHQWDKLQQALASTKLEWRISDNIRQDIWQKLLWNCAFNPTCALLEITVDELLASTTGKHLVKKIMLEVISLAADDGVTLDANLVDKLITASKTMQGFKPSMLEDKLHNRPIELEAICYAPLLSAMDDDSEVDTELNINGQSTRHKKAANLPNESIYDSPASSTAPTLATVASLLALATVEG